MTTANETAKMLEELKNEIEEEKQIISSLPFWGYIGADDQVRAKHVKLLAEKELEYLLIGENARIAGVIREHEELHPPETMECPICLDEMTNTELDSVIYFGCCGGGTCKNCGNVGPKLKSCPLCRADMPKGEDACSAQLVQCAEKGKSWAQSRMGHMHLNLLSTPFQKNLPIDKKKGLKFIKLAADGDEPNALYSLGHFFFEGTNGVKKDEARARVLYQKASGLGHTNSQLTLGALHFRDGALHEKIINHPSRGDASMMKAAHYFTLAYNQDETGQAAICFAQFYQHGTGGFSKSLPLANHYLKEAAEKGEKRAYFPLSMTLMDLYEIYYDGLPCPGHNAMPMSQYWARRSSYW